MPITKILKQGSQGLEVKELQNMLLSLEYSLDPAGADGKYGPITEQAVKLFQQSVGIKSDGIVGPVTRKAIIDELMKAEIISPDKAEKQLVPMQEQRPVSRPIPGFNINWKIVGITATLVLAAIVLFGNHNDS